MRVIFIYHRAKKRRQNLSCACGPVLQDNSNSLLVFPGLLLRSCQIFVARKKTSHGAHDPGHRASRRNILYLSFYLTRYAKRKSQQKEQPCLASYFAKKSSQSATGHATIITLATKMQAATPRSARGSQPEFTFLNLSSKSRRSLWRCPWCRIGLPRGSAPSTSED